MSAKLYCYYNRKY